MTKTDQVDPLTWDAVRDRLTAGAAAILPIGAAAKPHGLHLPMDTDRIQAEYFSNRLAAETGALIWPVLTYGYYPAFTAFAGSLSLSAKTFESVITDLLNGLHQTGAARVWILNSGISTLAPVDNTIAQVSFAAHVCHLKLYSGPAFTVAAQETFGTDAIGHADALETSLMLAIAPDRVAMHRLQSPTPAADKNPPEIFAPAGHTGAPACATAEFGQRLVDAIVKDLLASVRQCPQ